MLECDVAMPIPPFSSPPTPNPLPITRGGTGSQTQNFVDLSSNQTIGGIKTFGEISIGGAPTNSSNKLSVQSSAINFNYMSAPPACSAQLANLGAGNIPNGTYVYRVTFVNALGQSVGGGISNSVTVTDNTTNGQIQVTMSISRGHYFGAVTVGSSLKV